MRLLICLTVLLLAFQAKAIANNIKFDTAAPPASFLVKKAVALHKVDAKATDIDDVKTKAKWWVRYGNNVYTPDDADNDDQIDNYYVVKGQLPENDPLYNARVGGEHGYHIIHVDHDDQDTLNYLNKFQFRKLTEGEENLVEYEDGRQAYSSSLKDNTIKADTKSINSDSWMEKLLEITSFGSRNTYDPRVEDACNYIEGVFDDLGYDVELQDVSDSNVLEMGDIGDRPIFAKNVIAYKEGTTAPEEFIVLGAHYDDMPPPGEEAPGADDNGSGTSTLLEIARVLADIKMERSIYLVAYGAEEQGMVGSSRFVKEYVLPKSSNYKGGLTLDQDGYTTTPKSPTIIAETRPEWQPLLDTVAHTAKDFTDLKVLVNFAPFGSDHMSYLDNDLPSVLILEREDQEYPGYHKSSDKIENENPGFGATIAKLTLATMLRLGNPGSDLKDQIENAEPVSFDVQPSKFDNGGRDEDDEDLSENTDSLVQHASSNTNVKTDSLGFALASNLEDTSSDDLLNHLEKQEDVLENVNDNAPTPIVWTTASLVEKTASSSISAPPSDKKIKHQHKYSERL